MKNKIIVPIIIVVLLVLGLVGVFLLIPPQNSGKDDYTKISFAKPFAGKVGQWSETLGYVNRNIPQSSSTEGLNDRYPTYGNALSTVEDTERQNLIKESAILMSTAGNGSPYDAIDSNGNMYLSGVAIGKKLYKHISANGMYYGNVSDSEKAVVERITITVNEDRNFVTGLYAPAGEIVKIEISQNDLNAVGGSLIVSVGQVSQRDNVNNIWNEDKNKNKFTRMPVIASKLKVSTTTAYVGNHFGGPIYLRPSAVGQTFTVTISGAVKYPHYIHGQTTAQEWAEMTKSSVPYYDFEVWDLGVRLSGPRKYASHDYDNLVKVGDLWEKIVRTSRLVPASANSAISVGYVFDSFVAAGAAFASQGGNSWINAPCSWMAGCTNYNEMISSGFWGIIHEYNHLYQSYGMHGTKTNEVTNNATSLLSYILYTKISDARSTNDATLGYDWNRYTDPSRSLRETIANAGNGTAQSSLNTYADLIHTFGVDIFTRVTRTQTGRMLVDDWYEALSKATDYNFTYYFEKMLNQTISEEKKLLYNVANKITFVPIATTFQTGRDIYDGGKKVTINTVRPYCIERGESIIIDFNQYLIIPQDFTFDIKGVSQPDSGKIEKVGENVYKYTPGQAELSGDISVVVGLNSTDYTTPDVTLHLNFRQLDKNQVAVTKYTYAGSKTYSSVDEAVANNFAGYTNKTESKQTSTFLNGLANKQIGVVEGKVYIEKSGKYAICLRSGRGNNTLYLALNDISKMTQVLSLNTDHGGWAVSGEHVVQMDLKKGDYLYFKEITLSRHYANDAFTELGLACLDDFNPIMTTISTRILCTNNMLMPSSDFQSEAKYARVYNTGKLYSEDSSTHTLISANMPSWSQDQSAENIFDSDLNNYYHNNQNNFVSKDNPFELVADMNKIDTYNSITITSRSQGQLNLPCTFALYVSLDNSTWTLAGEYNDLSISNNSVTAKFSDQKFRYYKLFVTDTKSAGGGNKYVTIRTIEFAYTMSGMERNPLVMDYYKNSKTDFVAEPKLSTFGKIVKGNGKIEYDFAGSIFALAVRQDNNCNIRITLDGVTQEIKLTKDSTSKIAYCMTTLADATHHITIEVLSGNLCVDYIVTK